MFFVWPKSKQWEAGFFCDLREDFVLDQRVLCRDLLRVESRVKSLLSFDSRSVENDINWIGFYTWYALFTLNSKAENRLHLFKFCESELSTCVSGRRCLICGSRSWGRTVWSPGQEKINYDKRRTTLFSDFESDLRHYKHSKHKYKWEQRILWVILVPTCTILSDRPSQESLSSYRGS